MDRLVQQLLQQLFGAAAEDEMVTQLYVAL